MNIHERCGKVVEMSTVRQIQHRAYTAARAAGLDTNASDAVSRKVACAAQDGEIVNGRQVQARIDEEIQKHAAP